MSGALSVADRMAGPLAAAGARAVALVGSHARGDATKGSDLDLAVIGDGPHYRLEVRDGLLVSLGWASAEEQRRRLYDPSRLGTHVPGWRRAVLLHDPERLAADLQHEALAWRWEDVSDRCDAWVAESVAGYAEEFEKLAASLLRGDHLLAAAQRSLLALRLAGLIAVHRRILYGSENQLWYLVSMAMGPAWQEAQSAAFGIDGEDIDASCRAAQRLFSLAASEVRPVLDERQRDVVDHALAFGRCGAG
jgi:hypothetical protein